MEEASRHPRKVEITEVADCPPDGARELGTGSTWKYTGEEEGTAVPPPLRYEHFEVLLKDDGRLWLLGSGAMGATYKALDTRLRHHVALKVISADLIGHPVALERFLREARAVARLHHPNVARIFHLGETCDGAAAFHAMEYVEGETLEARVRRAGPLSIWLALEVGIEVARALWAACHQDLVHRDLKPANLMLVASAEAATVAAVGVNSSGDEVAEAWVKVIDFGLAKAVAGAGPLTNLGDFVGTPVYASPEQFAGGEEVDGRSDIYSLGATLWFALTGKLPFEGKTLTAVERQKLSVELSPTRLGAAGVPEGLAHLVTTMLAVDPGDRPQTPSILLDALRRCREELRRSASTGPGQMAAPPAFWRPLRRLRHRRICQVFLGYAVGAWLVLQITAVLLPNLDWPRWIMRAVLVTLLAGFGEALLLGWALERQAAGKALLPQRATRRLGVLLLALVPAVVVTAFFLQCPPLIDGSERKASKADAPPTESLSEKSVAVLPFENLSADRDNAFFTQGVQEEILTDLSKVADLKVISRASVKPYASPGPENLREIARTLGVVYVVEGSVQRAGNRIKVNAQLIDTRTGAHRWAGQYVRDLSDVFTIQSEIAQSVAGQLQVAISPREQAAMTEVPTHDEAAYELYLRAQATWNNYDDDPRKLWPATLDLLGQATARDPRFVRALVLMTEVQSCIFCYQEQSPANDLAARRSVEAVARLRPGSAEARLAAGYYHYFVRHDLGQSREDFAEVARQTPNDAQALVYLATVTRRQGDLEEALARVRRALELDPENVNAFGIYHDVLIGMCHYAELGTALDRRIASHPQQGHLRLAKAGLQLDWHADVRAARDELARLPAGFDPDGNATFIRVSCGVMERDYEAASRDLNACPSARIGGLPREWFAGEIARLRGDVSSAASSYAVAREHLEETARAEPYCVFVLATLALTDASLGHRTLAMEEGRHLLAQAPADDIRELPLAALGWAQVLVRCGAREEALRALQEVYGRPYGPSYGTLRLDPEWDPLRGDPRFEALVAPVAPQT